LLRIRVRDLFRTGKVRTGDAQVWEFRKRLAPEEERVRFRRLHRWTEGGILVHDLFQPAVGQFVAAGLLRVLAVGRKRDRLGHVDRPLAGRTTAAAALRGGLGRLTGRRLVV